MIVLDELDKFKETTKLSHEIETIRSVLENPSKPEDENPLEVRLFANLFSKILNRFRSVTSSW